MVEADLAGGDSSGHFALVEFKGHALNQAFSLVSSTSAQITTQRLNISNECSVSLGLFLPSSFKLN